MKSGQARVPTDEEWANLFAILQEKRHPVKNTAIMMISATLGLRAQEIALLEFKEVCRLSRYRKSEEREFTLHQVMSLPASYTKGSNAFRKAPKNTYTPTRLSFDVKEFDKILRDVVKLTKLGEEINPKDYHPVIPKRKGKSRDLPLTNEELRIALSNLIRERLDKDPKVKLSDPLIINQRGTNYTAQTMAAHMSKMLKEWAQIEKASSHSGRAALLTKLIHEFDYPLSVAQKIAGHVNPATTLIYAQPTEQEISDALKHLSIAKPKKPSTFVPEDTLPDVS